MLHYNHIGIDAPRLGVEEWWLKGIGLEDSGLFL